VKTAVTNSSETVTFDADQTSESTLCREPGALKLM